MRALLAVMVLSVGGSVEAGAQSAAGAGPQRAAREELTALLRDANQRATVGRPADRAAAKAQAGAIERRLQEGDFRVGDQFVVTTTHDRVRVDTASVRDSLLVQFAELPAVSVAGVLRSELNDRMNAHVARFLRNAVVRTNVLTRITITGAVSRPGTYYASPDRPVSELLSVAGGPAPDADVNLIEVTRGGVVVVSKKSSKQALQAGRTIEQLDIQSGDQVTIPKKRRINWQALLSTIAILSTLLFAFIQFLQFYYSRQD